MVSGMDLVTVVHDAITIAREADRAEPRYITTIIAALAATRFKDQPFEAAQVAGAIILALGAYDPAWVAAAHRSAIQGFMSEADEKNLMQVLGTIITELPIDAAATDD